MSRFKAKPKQKNLYPGILRRSEEQRKKMPPFNPSVKAAQAQVLQRFSGKRGK